MFAPLDRRRFLTGALAGLGSLAFLKNLPPVSAEAAGVKPDVVRLTSDIEPLVRLIEETPRNTLLEAAAEKVAGGTSYQQLLAALFLAGVRGIKPRPVGFKFHAVLVVNSANLASLAASDHDRWLPLFWALDNFKDAQAKNQKESDGWVMPAVDEAKLPPSHQARERFAEAMDNWDEEGADRAVVSLVRSASATEVVELFWRYGCRDFRDIGHKAIYVANSWRTLQTIGWRHAEPVVRSLAFALLEHEGDNPAQRDAEPDRPWRDNQKRAAKIRADWQHGKVTPDAASELLAALRTASPADGCDHVVDLLNRGVDPASVWDGLFLTAGEQLMRQPGIVGLHCVTSANSLHHAFQTSGNDETRRLLMLQTAAFLPMFRKAMEGRGKLDDVKIDTLEPAEPKAKGEAAVEEVFADVSHDRTAAARKTLALLSEDAAARAEALMAEARRLIFAKGVDSHDYKFSSAALEDFYHATPKWRARFLASSMFNLRGSGHKDNDLIKRARAALGKG
jgi:hypothetical protein